MDMGDPFSGAAARWPASTLCGLAGAGFQDRLMAGFRGERNAVPLLPSLRGGRALPTPPMELVIERLGCRRGGRTVFAGLDFRLPGGSAALVRGPNGAGKSSLLRILAGLLPPAAGDVRLGGASLARDRSALQESVALAGHLDAVKPALTVAENLRVWAGILGAGPERAAAALERFGLAPIADRPAGQCSAGQRRRLGLARLLVQDRPLWLLDEPTVSLDAASAAVVAELVRAHAAAGGMALIATHIDLGLGPVAVLDLPAPGAASGAATTPGDAFLEGEW
jgi:heme exporter protein A